MMTRWVTSTILLAFLFNSGCQTYAVDSTESTSEITPASEVIKDGSETPDRMHNMTKTPERVPTTEMGSKVTGEIPQEILDRIIADLVERTGIAADKILVIQAQATTWNDGSLGCPQPGMFYTQALVDGYWAILEADGVKFDYRVSGSGYFFLCENGFPAVSPPGTPDS